MSSSFMNKKILIIDLETTSFNGFTIEAAMMRFETIGIDHNMWSSDKVFFLLDPDSEISDEASRVNGYGLGAGKKPVGTTRFHEVADKIIDTFLSVDIIIAQYKSFELRILANDFSRAGTEFKGYEKFIDLIDIAKKKLTLDSYKLFRIAEALEIPYDKSKLHTGEYDVQITYECFVKLIEMPDVVKQQKQPKQKTEITLAESTSKLFIKKIEKEIDELAASIAPKIMSIKTKVTSVKDVDDSARKIALLGTLHSFVSDSRKSLLAPIKSVSKLIEERFRNEILSKIEEKQHALILARTSFLKSAAETASKETTSQIAAIQQKAEQIFSDILDKTGDFDKASEEAGKVAATAPEQASPERRVSDHAVDRILYIARIVDKELVPQLYWSPDLTIIQASVDAGNLEIPGVVVEKVVKSSFKR